MKQGIIRRTILALALSAFGASTMAQVTVQEQESNDSIATAQKIFVAEPGTTATIKGIIGTMTGAPVVDVDFYAFWGNAGQVISFNIDHGIKAVGEAGRSVDTTLTLFGPAPHPWKFTLGDASSADFPGSVSRFDPRFSFKLDATGWWVIAVTPYKVAFQKASGGVLALPAVIDTGFKNGEGNGDYTLLITGLSPSPIREISIDIKPGSEGLSAPLNPTSKGNIPVALLSSSDFNALDVKTDAKTLKFGPLGKEQESLRRCAKEGEDVNGDGRLDLICHFDTELSKFTDSDEVAGIVGQTTSGVQFKGTGHLKVVPVKRPGD